MQFLRGNPAWLLPGMRHTHHPVPHAQLRTDRRHGKFFHNTAKTNTVGVGEWQMPFAVKHLQQLLRSEPFAFILHSRNSEGLKESLLHGRNPFEFAVLKCQRSLLPGIKPPPFAVAEAAWAWA